MALKLYNTLTRQKSDFVPIDPKNVRMYVCGPTVYDFAHIGNARPVIVFDVLFRLLRHIYGPDHVTYVRNITDVDDKINARAARDYPDLPLNEAIRKVTTETEKQFHADIAALGVLPPTYEPRATEYIRRDDGREDMVSLIETLVARGNAYVAEDHVLFDVASMPDYGRLSNRSLDEMEAGARVEVAPYKKGPMDFVLWKPSKPGEPAWPSPVGIKTPGRPGWHIECSAMSGALLGDVFDIHGGGIDLAFPHHENEIAQSRCAHGTPVMANVWMHNGFLQVEGEKMSKSLGNFVTINELLRTDKFGGRRWPGAVVKIAMIKNNYRQPIDWTVKALEDGAEEVAEWSARLDDPFVKMALDNAKTSGVNISPYGEVIDALSDDLNTADVLAHIRSVVRKITREDAEARARLLANLSFLGLINPDLLPAYRLGVTSLYISPHDAKQYERVVVDIRTSIANNDLQAISNIIKPYHSKPVTFEYKPETGSVFLRGTDTNINERIELLIAARLEARKRKDFKESDRIRDELAKMGIALKDTKNKETGEIETTWEVVR